MNSLDTWQFVAVMVNCMDSEVRLPGGVAPRSITHQLRDLEQMTTPSAYFSHLKTGEYKQNLLLAIDNN